MNYNSAKILSNIVAFCFFTNLILFTLLAQEIQARTLLSLTNTFFAFFIILTKLGSDKLSMHKGFSLSSIFLTLLVLHLFITIILLFFRPSLFYASIVHGSAPFLVYFASIIIFKNYTLNFEKSLRFVFFLSIPLIVLVYINSGRLDLYNLSSTRVSNISNIAAMFLLLSLVFRTSVTIRLCQIILIVIIILGLKRSGLLFLFGVAVVFSLSIESRRKVLFLFLLLAPAILYLTEDYMKYFLVVFELMQERIIAIGDGGSGRTTIWSGLLSYFIVQDIPFKLIGNGYGFFGSNINPAFASAHNDFLELMISYGIIGSVLYLLLLMRLVYITSAFYSLANSKYFRLSGAVLAAFVIYGAVAGIFYFYMYFSFIFVLMAYLETKLALNLPNAQ